MRICLTTFFLHLLAQSSNADLGEDKWDLYFQLCPNRITKLSLVLYYGTSNTNIFLSINWKSIIISVMSAALKC